MEPEDEMDVDPQSSGIKRKIDDSSKDLSHEPVNSQLYDILTLNSAKINQKFVINQQLGIAIDREAKKNCKILKLSIGWNYEKISKILQHFDISEYPNLFIFIIDIANADLEASASSTKSKDASKANEIKNIFKKFSQVRSIVLQLSSVDEKLTKFYYKEQESVEFEEVDNLRENPEKIVDFGSFLRALINADFEDIKESLAENIFEMKESAIILRFLRIFETSEDFWDGIILKCASEGKLNDFLAVLDAPFDSQGRVLSTDAQRLILTIFEDEESQSESEVDENDKNKDNEQELSSEQDESKAPAEDQNEQKKLSETSVLDTAIQHSNQEIINFLITYWTHLIQQLPFSHQVQISTTTFNSNQFDVLCDLIQISDFPFPENFKLNGIENERLKEIVAERTKFSESIDDEDLKKIKKFIKKNINLKVAYNTENKSAMKQAVDEKSYKSFYFLKSQGFYATEFRNIEEVLSKDELKEAFKIKSKQMRLNVKKGLSSEQQSVNLLCNRSFIHDRKTVKDKEAEYRKVIRKWFEDINNIKYGTEFLNVAASCEDLKIIFDFESTTDENVSLGRAGSSGVMYPYQKWIFIGAKLEEGKRFQKVKGVLAHELCHYVMKLIYENAEHPYCKHCKATVEKFEAVVAAINKWLSSGPNDPDDECDGIISTVFRFYAAQDHHPELIVRVMQILAQYDNNSEKSDQLEDKYKVLFNYWEEQVWPEIKKFDLKKREKVRKINRILQLMNMIKECELGLKETKIDINALLDNKFVIIKSNVPKLLLIDIYDKLYDKFGVLMDAKNIFVDPKVLENSEHCEDFKKLLKENPKLNLIVDCTAQVCEELKTITFSSESSLFFVVRNENQAEEAKQILTNQWSKDISVEYNWNDLTPESQDQLLQTKVNFQNNSKVSLLELFEPKKKLQDPRLKKSLSKYLSQSTDLPSSSPAIDPFSDRSGINFSGIVDVELLNLILNQQPIPVNNGFKEPENFCFLSKSREFKSSWSFYTDYDLLYKVQNDKFVLISDIAGNGKSWAMIQISRKLMEKYPTCWTTNVDLKQFIQEFKAQQNEILEFSKFLLEKILKFDKNNFEAKIFQKMYEIGKIFVIFDGFDEIAPDCAEFVSKLAKSFEQNGGNQLWIATRDYFKVNLQQELRIKEAWKLKDFSVDEGAEFIAKSWMLNEPEAKEIKTKKEFGKLIKKSEKYKNFLEMAKKIAEKVSVSKSKYKSIGMPQIYKIVAEISKDNKKATIGYTQTDLYKSLFQELFWRWGTQKGDIRIQANKNSLEFDLKFKEIHQFLAILTLFPEIAEVLFPNYDKSEWTDEEIVAGGIVRIKDAEKKSIDDSSGDSKDKKQEVKTKKYLFNHETLREYFVADFIAKELKKVSSRQEVVDMFTKILTKKKFGVIRTFLNEMLSNADLNKIVTKMQNDKNIKMFRDMNTFEDIYRNRHDQFIELHVLVLKSKSDELSKILINHACELLKKSTTFKKFQKILFEHCNDKHLKKLITEKPVFQLMIKSELEIEYFEEFLKNLDEKLGIAIVNEGLKSRTEFGNIFYMLKESENFNVSKLKKFLEILKKYLNLGEIFKLMYNCDWFGATFLQIILESTRNPLEYWIAIEEMMDVEMFKKLVSKQNSRRSNILFYSDELNVDEFKKFWEKMLELFKGDLKALEEMIMKIDYYRKCFMNK